MQIRKTLGCTSRRDRLISWSCCGVTPFRLLLRQIWMLCRTCIWLCTLNIVTDEGLTPGSGGCVTVWALETGGQPVLTDDFCGFLGMTEGCRSFCRTHALCSGKLAFAVRKAYRQSCVHSRAVLTGAAVSDACFRAMKREVIDHHVCTAIPLWYPLDIMLAGNVWPFLKAALKYLQMKCKNDLDGHGKFFAGATVGSWMWRMWRFSITWQGLERSPWEHDTIKEWTMMLQSRCRGMQHPRKIITIIIIIIIITIIIIFSVGPPKFFIKKGMGPMPSETFPGFQRQGGGGDQPNGHIAGVGDRRAAGTAGVPGLEVIGGEPLRYSGRLPLRLGLGECWEWVEFAGRICRIFCSGNFEFGIIHGDWIFVAKFGTLWISEVGKSGGDMGCCWQQQPRLSTQRPLAVTGTWRLDGIISIGLVGGLQMNGIEDWELRSENEWCSNNLAAMEPNFAMRSLKPYFHRELRNRVPLEKG